MPHIMRCRPPTRSPLNLLLCAALATELLGVTPAIAQQSPNTAANPESPGLEEVVVTARYRSEDLQRS